MAQQNERLLLQVDAATELFRQRLLEAEPSLDRFEQRAERMASTVDRSIGDMGKRFGAFSDLAESAAQRAEKSFEASFSQVQKIAASAIKGPTVDGRINLGADDIRAGAAAAQQEARAFALIGDAAERAAKDIGDTSEATRLFIAATAASRIEAERKAAALLAEAGALERVEIELRQSAGAVDLFVTSHQRVAQAAEQERQLAISTREAAAAQASLAAQAKILRGELDPMFAAQQRFDAELDRAEDLYRAGAISLREYNAAQELARDRLHAHAQAVTGNAPVIEDGNKRLVSGAGAVRAAMSGASFQVQDFFTQISMGGNIVNAFVVQGGQLTGQFSTLDAKAGTALGRFVAFSQFMQSPWGIAIQIGAFALMPLINAVDLFDDKIGDATKKLKEDAAQSDVAAKAKARYSNSVEGVTAALKEQDKALKQVAESERSSAERANIEARALRDKALAIRQTTVAHLEEAKARLAALSTPGASDARLVPARDEAAANVARLEGDLTKAKAAAKEAERQLNVTRVDIAAELAAIANDPIASVTKHYDKLINAEKARQRAAARSGEIIGAQERRILEQLNAQKKVAIETAQERQRLANQRPSASANNQLGREIDVDEARRIVASIGGRVTSGVRSTERQAELYADKLAGRHKGPVAKPGTSDHERGQAVDVAYGPGITIASIRQAFAKQGVALRQILDEPAQRVFHVAFGKKGPSRETVAKREESARVKLLNDEIAFGEQERAAQRRLTQARLRGAETEEQRERLALDGINDQADAENRKITDQLDAKKLTQAQADRLTALNEATRTEQTGNLIVARANRVIERRFDVEQDDLEARLAMLRIGEDLATTEADRRRIAQDILEAEQALRRKALERVRDTSQDPDAVLRAKRQLDRLPAIEAGEQQQSDLRNAGPLEQYVNRLKAASDDMGTAVEVAAIRGFGALEDAGSRATAQAVTDLLGLKGVAADVVGSVIADLARLAIQKAIVSAIGGGFLGFADGGSLSTVPGFADGGSPGGQIRGPGTGRSDSILALLRGPGGKAVRLSNREFIMNERAVDFYGADAMAAINARQLPRFANGGSLSGPRLATPALRAPRLPDLRGAGARGRQVQVTGDIRLKPTREFHADMENLAFRTVTAAADPIMDGAMTQTMERLNRPDLPGGYG